MSQYRRVTRGDKHTKRRNNNRKLLFFVVLAAIFIIILFLLLMSGNDDDVKEENETETETEDISLDSEQSSQSTVSPDDEQLDDETNIDDVDEIEAVDDVVIQQIDSTDENVIEAYTGNWPPIETEQQEPHTTNYNDGSDDRKEIKSAALLVTGIDEENIVEHWVGNGGDQKVISTVEDTDKNEYYHVYLTWVEQEGWQVEKVERIKQLRKK